MTAQALQMGDEGHNRNRAGTSLLLRELLPALIELDEPAADTAAVARFIAGNDHFFLNLTMPASKAIADAAAGIDRSSIVVAMARNGTEFGIRLSGTGDRWFTGPSGMIDGLYLPGFGPEDANPDIGDSTITETVGLGGFAMAAAPAIVRVVGGGAEDALEATRAMYDISLGREPPLPDPGARLPRHAARDRLPRGRAHAPAAVRQHRHRAPRAGGGADRRRAGEAADGGVREGRAGARRAVIAHTVAAPVAGRRLRSTHVSRPRATPTRRVRRRGGRAGRAAAAERRRAHRPPRRGASCWRARRSGTRRCASAVTRASRRRATRHWPMRCATRAGRGDRRGLIGRGPGLTPEGDDAVAGIAAVVAAAGAGDGLPRSSPKTSAPAQPRSPPRCSSSPRRA